MSWLDDVQEVELPEAIDALTDRERVRLLLELTESRPDLADLPLRVAVLRLRRGEVRRAPAPEPVGLAPITAGTKYVAREQPLSYDRTDHLGTGVRGYGSFDGRDLPDERTG